MENKWNAFGIARQLSGSTSPGEVSCARRDRDAACYVDARKLHMAYKTLLTERGSLDTVTGTGHRAGAGPNSRAESTICLDGNQTFPLLRWNGALMDNLQSRGLRTSARGS